jgi:hypothetical protein
MELVSDDESVPSLTATQDPGMLEHTRRMNKGKAKRAADQARRTSARLADKEAANHVDMTVKASKLRALRDALVGCSPRLQAKVAKEKILGASCKPLGAKAVVDLRDSVVPCTAPVSTARDA